MDNNTRNILIVGTSVLLIILGANYYFKKKMKSEFEGEGNVDVKSKKSNKIEFTRA